MHLMISHWTGFCVTKRKYRLKSQTFTPKKTWEITEIKNNHRKNEQWLELHRWIYVFFSIRIKFILNDFAYLNQPIKFWLLIKGPFIAKFNKSSNVYRDYGIFAMLITAS